MMMIDSGWEQDNNGLRKGEREVTNYSVGSYLKKGSGEVEHVTSLGLDDAFGLRALGFSSLAAMTARELA